MGVGCFVKMGKVLIYTLNKTSPKSPLFFTGCKLHPSGIWIEPLLTIAML